MKHLILVIFAAAYLPLSGQTYNEILGRPTNNSMTVSVMFNQLVEVYIEYGVSQGVYPFSTSVISNTINTPDEIEITSLIANTRYYYRTRYRLSGNGTYMASPEHSFITQRAPGSTFTFTVESDVHLYDKKGCTNLYNICLANQAADNPDFMIDMGDTYGDDRDVPTMTNVISDSLHKYYRPLLGQVCHSFPYYFCMGNHEGEFDYYLAQTPPNNLAVWGTLWRKFYFANPYPNSFYSGNTEVEGYGMGNPENYYAWTWGDALFVVLDAYRYQSVSDTSVKPQKWDWTLGATQYTWFKNTLENSNAQYKFVFIHQLLGQGRGGILDAPYYEWGGLNGNGNNQFATYRPGWAEPIHQLMVNNGVNILFHGHDHVFAHEVLDGLTYLEVPMPSDSTYMIGMLANSAAYASDTVDGSGHIRVTVSPLCAQVDYVKAFLPADTLSGLNHNGEVAFSFTLGDCQTQVTENKNKNEITVYPNPFSESITIEAEKTISEIIIIDILGNKVNTSTKQIDQNRISTGSLSKGIYLLKVVFADNTVAIKKIIK